MRPPSSDTSTRAILPRPDHANPDSTVKPDLWLSGACGLGSVMTDLASITKVKRRAMPFSSRSVYLEVSSRVIHGSLLTLMRRTHLILELPSQPGQMQRMG